MNVPHQLLEGDRNGPSIIPSTSIQDGQPIEVEEEYEEETGEVSDARSERVALSHGKGSLSWYRHLSALVLFRCSVLFACC